MLPALEAVIDFFWSELAREQLGGVKNPACARKVVFPWDLNDFLDISGGLDAVELGGACEIWTGARKSSYNSLHCNDLHERTFRG